MWQVHGLKNCDTCRKARKWLDAEGIAYQFVDVRSDGLDRSDVERWAATIGEKLINRRGTTWRGLSGDEQAQADGKEGTIDLALAYPALIRRPVFTRGPRVLQGFDAKVREALSVSGDH
ncbi:MAG: Spx/MgsR family RNA polymerase-binding regulatory protein [Minwuia sp.]|nr:Spx/MgsR family RNA polymerase-binding regulatory protein [Minwuia sp.]